MAAFGEQGDETPGKVTSLKFHLYIFSFMQENQNGLKLNWTRHYLGCAVNVNLIDQNFHVKHQSFIGY